MMDTIALHSSTTTTCDSNLHKGVTYEPLTLSTSVADYPYIKRFRQITSEMADLYARKNADYGNSFAKSVDEFGLVAGLVRLSDKWNRVCELIKKNTDPKVTNESLMDTALDGACYFVMLAMEIERLSSGLTQADIDKTLEKVRTGQIEFGEHGLNDPALWRITSTPDPHITLTNPRVPHDNNDSIVYTHQATC